MQDFPPVRPVEPSPPLAPRDFMIPDDPLQERLATLLTALEAIRRACADVKICCSIDQLEDYIRDRLQVAEEDKEPVTLPGFVIEGQALFGLRGEGALLTNARYIVPALEPLITTATAAFQGCAQTCRMNCGPIVRKRKANEDGASAESDAASDQTGFQAESDRSFHQQGQQSLSDDSVRAHKRAMLSPTTRRPRSIRSSRLCASFFQETVRFGTRSGSVNSFPFTFTARSTD